MSVTLTFTAEKELSMRFVRSSLVLCLAIACLIPLAALGAHHVNGTWVLSVDLGGQGGDATFVLEEKEAGVLTGTYSGAVGSAEVTGKVSGNEVEFSFSSDQAGTVTYKGTITDGVMSGTCSYGDLGSGTFSGKKKE